MNELEVDKEISRLAKFNKEEKKRLEEFDDLFEPDADVLEKGFINPGYPGEPRGGETL